MEEYPAVRGDGHGLRPFRQRQGGHAVAGAQVVDTQLLFRAAQQGGVHGGKEFQKFPPGGQHQLRLPQVEAVQKAQLQCRMLPVSKFRRRQDGGRFGRQAPVRNADAQLLRRAVQGAHGHILFRQQGAQAQPLLLPQGAAQAGFGVQLHQRLRGAVVCLCPQKPGRVRAAGQGKAVPRRQVGIKKKQGLPLRVIAADAFAAAARYAIPGHVRPGAQGQPPARVAAEGGIFSRAQQQKIRSESKKTTICGIQRIASQIVVFCLFCGGQPGRRDVRAALGRAAAQQQNAQQHCRCHDAESGNAALDVHSLPPG